jgi:hypothetical protein
MRSVFVYLRDTTEAEVAAFLTATYPTQPPHTWVRLASEDDAFLYIDFYYDGQSEHEPEDWQALVAAFGGEPAVALMADVSGRHPGDAEVREFVRAVLGRFSGAAKDDYTDHLWSLEEVEGGRLVEGHPFFDYAGWADD